MRFSLCFIFCLLSLWGQAQVSNPEILLIGTMHQVPGIFQRSYQPLYQAAYAYEPEAIFVEVAMPNDSLSWAYLKEGYSKGHRQFYALSVAVRDTFAFRQTHLDSLLQKPIASLTAEDYEQLQLSFLYLRDQPNYFYYRYLQQYFPAGHPKAYGHENVDLSRKLAMTLGHRKVYAADDQQTNDRFHAQWQACEQAIAGTSYERREKQLVRKLIRRELFPGLWGRYGMITNHPKDLALVDSLSALRFADPEVEACRLAQDYFDQRNYRFAHNLGTQIQAHGFRKSVLFVGAAHVVGLRKALKTQFPEIKVQTLSSLE